jgi:hypothetical protein
MSRSNSKDKQRGIGEAFINRASMIERINNSFSGPSDGIPDTSIVSSSKLNKDSFLDHDVNVPALKSSLIKQNVDVQARQNLFAVQSLKNRPIFKFLAIFKL